MSRMVMDIYVRVSCTGGREGSDSFHSPAIQRSEATAWASRNGVTVGKVVEELDVSGGKAVADRKLNDLVKRVERRVSGGIIVYRVDRFARDSSRPFWRSGG